MFGRVGSAPNWKWNDVSMCRLRDLPTKQFHGFEAAVLVHRSNPSGLVIPPMFQLQKYESQEHNPRWRLTFNWNWNLFTAIRFLANPKSTFRSNSCFHTSCSCWLCSSLAYASRAAQQNRILYIYRHMNTGKIWQSTSFPYEAYFLSLQWNTHARTWVIMGIGICQSRPPAKSNGLTGFIAPGAARASRACRSPDLPT